MHRVSLGEICGAVVKLSPISHLQSRFKCSTAQGFKFIGASLLNNGQKVNVSITDKYGILRTIKTIVLAHCRSEIWIC